MPGGVQLLNAAMSPTPSTEKTVEEMVQEFRALIDPWYTHWFSLQPSPGNIDDMVVDFQNKRPLDLNTLFSNLEATDIQRFVHLLLSKGMFDRTPDPKKKQELFDLMAEKLEAHHLVNITKAIRDAKLPKSSEDMLAFGDSIVRLSPPREIRHFVDQLKQRMSDQLVVNSGDKSLLAPAPEAVIIARLLGERIEDPRDPSWYPRLLYSLSPDDSAKVLVGAFGEEIKHRVLSPDRVTFQPDRLTRLLDASLTRGSIETACRLVDQAEALRERLTAADANSLRQVDAVLERAHNLLGEQVSNVALLGLPLPVGCPAPVLLDAKQ